VSDSGLADETALRSRAYKLQALYIRLLFCARLRATWRASPETVLAQAGLEPAARQWLPDIDSDRFRAEAHGRRVVVERSIGRAFTRATALPDKMAAASGWNGTVPAFDDFLCSPYFFDPGRALPHPTGVGPGYENISKYFFWLRDVMRLDQPQADTELRTAAYVDFAIYLLKENQRPHIPYYDRFKGGLYWRHRVGIPVPVVLITDRGKMLTIGDPETVCGLARIGLVDLDELEPPAAREDSMVL
jgi:hypothetical protein